MEQRASIRDRSPIRVAVAIALIVIGSSVLVSACTGGGNDQGSDRPVEVAEIDLTELDVEMHYAVG